MFFLLRFGLVCKRLSSVLNCFHYFQRSTSAASEKHERPNSLKRVWTWRPSFNAGVSVINMSKKQTDVTEWRREAHQTEWIIKGNGQKRINLFIVVRCQRDVTEGQQRESAGNVVTNKDSLTIQSPFLHSCCSHLCTIAVAQLKPKLWHP